MLWILLITVLGMSLTAWATNSVMLLLLLRPAEFIGLRPVLGWRGIVPARAARIAHPLVENITTHIGTVAELYQTIGPERLAEHMAHSLRPRVGEIIEDVILEEFPALWDSMDESLVRELTARINQRLAPIIQQFMHDLGENIEHYLDVPQLTQARLVDHPELLVALFENVGNKEFRFIRRGGAWLGALGGLLVSLVAWQWTGWGALIPACALILAGINALLLALLFYPRQPLRLGNWILQGLFPRRQEEAAAVACRIFTRDVIGLQQLMHLLFMGQQRDEIRAQLRRQVHPVIDEAAADLADDIVPRIGTRGFERLKERIAQDTVDITRIQFDDPIFNHERQVAVERTFLDRLLELPPVEFEQLLRPAFKDMEWLLVVGGGLAGGIAGALLSAWMAI